MLNATQHFTAATIDVNDSYEIKSYFKDWLVHISSSVNLGSVAKTVGLWSWKQTALCYLIKKNPL